jgi:hypothetical protein
MRGGAPQALGKIAVSGTIAQSGFTLLPQTAILPTQAETGGGSG